MKKLLTLGLLATSLVLADEGSEVVSLMKAPEIEKEAAPVKASYGYVSLGLGLGSFPTLLPVFGVGGRFQNGHHGFDGSIQFGSLGRFFTVAKENFNYLYYFKPNLASQFYVGGGVAFTELWEHSHMGVLLSPQAIVGKQYTNKEGGVRYFQVQIDPVFLDLKRMHKEGRIRGAVSPAVVFSYGLCF